jgi:hypothetical protein
VPATRVLVHAAAMDAATRRMRAQGRTTLSDEDVDVYIATFDRLFHALGGVEGWLAMPSQ